MSPQRPPAPDADDRDTDDRLAGLARELDQLRRRTDPLPGRLDQLAAVVAGLTENVAALGARKAPTPCPSWLHAPNGTAQAATALGELCAWLGVIYLRYSDAATTLPECWPWHPDIVEELLWLMHAWLAAYQGPAASVALAADWHDRHRPGVVRRIRAVAGSCSRESHMTREGWKRLPSVAPEVPAVEALEIIATWWGERREQTAPEPEPRRPEPPR